MTIKTNSRLAGVMYLLYIATGVTDMIVMKPMSGVGTAARLASLAQHPALARLGALFSFAMMMDAFILAVALYALTRDYNRELALLALCCRLAEGLLGTVNAVVNRALLALATAPAGADTAATHTLAGALFSIRSANVQFGATAFAIGSTIFCYLFLRARTVPASLAWLGLIGSLILVIGLPLQMLQIIGGSITYLMWIPVALFEVAFAVWLLVKGVNGISAINNQPAPIPA